MTTVYQPIAPAATLPADGKAGAIRVYNKSGEGPSFANLGFDVYNDFNLGIPAGGAFKVATPFKIMSTLEDSFAQFKTFFEWLGLYKQQAVDEAKVMVDDEKDRAEGVESGLQASIDDEKGRAEGVEAGLQSQITNLLSNTDEVALNSLAELVAEFSTNGTTITTALQAEVTFARAEAADLRTRLDAVEILLASLVNSSA